MPVSQITVKDASNNNQDVYSLPGLGQSNTAGSLPTVLANNQPQINVGAHPQITGRSDLPSITNNTTNTLYTDLSGQLKTLSNVSSLPGLSTGANVIGNVSVSSITLPGLSTGANNIGTVNVASGLPTGANVIGAVTQSGSWTIAATTSAIARSDSPSITNNTTNSLYTDLTGALKITGSISAETSAISRSDDPSITNNTSNSIYTDLSGKLKTNTSISILPGLSVGANNIGTVNVASGLPTGANVIGNVSVSSITLPGLSTGANVIGAITQSGSWDINDKAIARSDLPSVTNNTSNSLYTDLSGQLKTLSNVSSLPGLSTSANNIGVVNVASGLPTGANVIGAVTQSGTWNTTINAGLPTGANNIGTVNVASGLPTGANVIGAVTQSGSWTVSAATSAIARSDSPSITNNTTNTLYTDLTGALRITGSISATTTAIARSDLPSISNNTTNSIYTDLSGQLKVLANISAGSANIGYVGGFNFNITNTPTINLSSYAIAQTVGGSQTLNCFRSTTQPSGVIDNFWISSKGGALAPLTIYIFNKPLAASTNTDHVAFALGNADISSLVTAPFIITPAVIGSGTTASFAVMPLSVSAKNMESTPNTNLYVVAVQTTSAQTYLTTDDLVFGMNGIND